MEWEILSFNGKYFFIFTLRDFMVITHSALMAGYLNIPIFSRLNAISFRETEETVFPVEPWASLRSVFEYLECVELARTELLSLPKGDAIGNVSAFQGKYHSASMVFFAQAACDNLAVWLNEKYDLSLKGNNISFYKPALKLKLLGKTNKYDAAIIASGQFISILNNYRMEWLHRISGGAFILSGNLPGLGNTNFRIAVPIDPKDEDHKGADLFANREKVMAENGGKWFLTIDEFANYIADGVKMFVSDIIASAYDDLL